MKEKIDVMFGSFIRMRRSQLGLTQEQVAELIGIGRTGYIKYENGSRSVNPQTIFKLQEVLKFNIDDFFKLFKKWETENQEEIN